jgi:hypothetical protein
MGRPGDEQPGGTTPAAVHRRRTGDAQVPRDARAQVPGRIRAWRLGGHGCGPRHGRLHDSASSATGAKSGGTGLSFEADDIEELKERLQAAGYQDATVWDEAYGRVLSVTAPVDAVIWVDQRNDDLYGYKLHDAKPDERWSVTPTLQVSDRDTWQHFLETLGGDSTQLVSFGPPAAELVVQLGLSTTESLAEVEQRLAQAGYPPTAIGSGLTVEDPDGQLVTVKRA